MTEFVFTRTDVMWGLSLAMRRLHRDGNSRRAGIARNSALPGEPHAKSRARILAVENALSRRVERAMLYGESA